MLFFCLAPSLRQRANMFGEHRPLFMAMCWVNEPSRVRWQMQLSRRRLTDVKLATSRCTPPAVSRASSHGVRGRCGRKYLHIIGITRREVHDIRKNLLVPSEDKDNPDLLSTFSMGSRDVEGASPALDQISKVRSAGGPTQHTAQATSHHPLRTGTTCRDCTQQYKRVSHRRGRSQTASRFCFGFHPMPCPYVPFLRPRGHAPLDAACLRRKMCGCHLDGTLARHSSVHSGMDVSPTVGRGRSWRRTLCREGVTAVCAPSQAIAAPAACGTRP